MTNTCCRPLLDSRLHSEEEQPVPSSQWINEAEMIQKESSKSQVDDNLSVSLEIAHVRPYASQAVNILSNRFKVPTTTLAMASMVPFFPATTIAITWFNALSSAITLHRNKLVKEHSIQLKTIITILSSAWKMDTVKGAKAVWRTGGGRKNAAWTLTVMAAVTLVLLRPLLHSVSGDAASVIRTAL